MTKQVYNYVYGIKKYLSFIKYYFVIKAKAVVQEIFLIILTFN